MDTGDKNLIDEETATTLVNSFIKLNLDNYFAALFFGNILTKIKLPVELSDNKFVHDSLYILRSVIYYGIVDSQQKTKILVCAGSIFNYNGGSEQQWYFSIILYSIIKILNNLDQSQPALKGDISDIIWAEKRLGSNVAIINIIKGELPWLIDNIVKNYSSSVNADAELIEWILESVPADYQSLVLFNLELFR